MFKHEQQLVSSVYVVCVPGWFIKWVVIIMVMCYCYGDVLLAPISNFHNDWCNASETWTLTDRNRKELDIF